MTSVPGAMDGRPLLSVLMPVYNEARTLRQFVYQVPLSGPMRRALTQ